ncbi:unnamed protein product, partial [Prunus brigantina]
MSGTALAKILDKHCLEGHNFPEWFRNLKIVLISEKIAYVIDKPFPRQPPGDDVTEEEHARYFKHIQDDTQAKCYILASMNSELQKQHEHMDCANDMITHLQELYGEGTRNRRFSAVCELVKTKMVKGAPVHQHVLKMIGLIEQLENLGTPLDGELAQDFILASLSDQFSQFVMNYNMGKMDQTLAELLHMLVTAEKTFKKESGSGIVAAFEKGSSSSTKPKPKTKGKGKGKEKKTTVVKPKGKITKKKAKEPKGICFYCNENGHWKRNCKKYLASLNKNKPSE